MPAKKKPEAAEAAAEETPNGVLIVRTQDDDGNIGTNTVPLGDVTILEVQTVLELGLASWRKKIGLEA